MGIFQQSTSLNFWEFIMSCVKSGMIGCLKFVDNNTLGLVAAKLL